MTSITANNGPKYDIGTLEKKKNTAVSKTGIVPVVDRKKIARKKERRATKILGIHFKFIKCKFY